MPKANRFTESLIYDLKREYGFEASIYRESRSVDITSGIKDSTNQVFKVRRAVILNSDWKRRFLGIPSKNFNYGGFIDSNERTILFDVRDLPKTLIINNDDYVVIGLDKYNISSSQLVEEHRVWILTIKALHGEVPNRILDVQGRDRLYSTEDSNVTVE